MQIVSPRIQRSTRGRKVKKHTIVAPGVHVPPIFVRIDSPSAYRNYDYRQARIVLKRTCYRYLVWKENGAKKEFYLGKVKPLTPLTTCRRISPAAGARAAAAAKRGVRN